ncbi:hypothetical protein CN361_31525, partial [Bacillus cereus]
MTRLKRKYKNESTIDYISVVEPQGRGAWHCRVLLRFNDKDSIFLPNKFEEKDGKQVPVDAPIYTMWEKG